MAESSKDELLQLIKRFGAYLTVKMSSLFPISLHNLNSRSIGAIAGFAVAIVFTWRLLRSPSGPQRRQPKRQSPASSSSGISSNSNATLTTTGVSPSQDSRAQNVVDEFFQPVKPTLGQIVGQKLSEGRKVTCRLLGVVLEQSTPEELQKQVTVRETATLSPQTLFTSNPFNNSGILLPQQPPMEEDSSAAPPTLTRQDFGKMEYGCDHYRRRCKIRAPCCDQIFHCRHCHNEAASSLSNPKERHELVRHDVKQVVCSVCNTEQQVAQLCSNCGVYMGEYYCDICKFFDDDTHKGQFHCNECGICRVGGSENFFHCQKCGSCYAVALRDNHLCVEDSMKNHCPVCYEYLFDSVKVTNIMKCGHTMHSDCFIEMQNQNQYRCPICSKAVLDMGNTWNLLDAEIEATAMPEEYQYEVSILCNDCNTTSKAPFHIFGHKCGNCNSYNTRVIDRPTNHQ